MITAKADKKRKKIFPRRSLAGLHSQKLLKRWFGRLKKNPSYTLIALTTVGFFLFIISILLFRNDQLFKIKTISCKLDGNNCSPVYSNLTQNIMGSNLWQFDAALFTRNITNLNPLIKEVEIKKIFPSKIEINFIKRTPFAEVVDANGRQILVDKQGKLYASATAEGLTKIYIMESISVGEDAASILLLKALEILKLLEGSFIPAESINIISDESIKVKLFDNFQVWLSPNKDLNKQVDALHLILQNSKMIEGEETITEVDLRYESPVVR